MWIKCFTKNLPHLLILVSVMVVVVMVDDGGGGDGRGSDACGPCRA